MNELQPTRSSNSDPKTIIAVVLSVVIITGGILINDRFFAPKQATVAQTAAATPAPAVTEAVQAPATGPASGIRAADAPAPKAAAPAVAPAVEVAPTTYTVETDLLVATFTNKGGDLLSLKLKQHKDKGEGVDLIMPGQADAKALTVAFGGAGAAPLSDLMEVRMLDPTTIEFSKTYVADVAGKSSPVPFTFRKVFTFRNGEYLFGMAVALENSVNEILPLNAGGFAYTIGFEPQVGPSFNAKSKNSDYRRIETFVDGKRKEEKPKNAPWTIKGQPSWLGVGGKYFTFLEIPEVQNYTATLSSATTPEHGQQTGLSLSRPAVAASKQVDTYYFYFGPKVTTSLSRYNYAKDNAFAKADLHLESAADTSGILRPLEVALKFFLNIFYKLVPNYGVAIILVTLLVKAILFPLTKNGSVSSAKMQELQPKIQELQAKYKNNPQKLNQEMAELYKKEGANPMSGCLPLLIQFPIFIAMYNLFNTHFDLRGALFIPGWIPDLSAPESVWNFSPFTLPVLGWTDLRLLPIIYLASQLVYGKFTQQPSTGQAAAQMKLMMYGMPIIFFFILYDVPSGLLVYWIASNLLTIVQQLAINDYLKKRKKATLSVVKK